LRTTFSERFLMIHALTLVFACLGAIASALALMLVAPLTIPPPLASVTEGARRIGTDGAPALSRFQARDGTWLAYRLYGADNGARDRVAFLAHGSSAQSIAMNQVGLAIAQAGVTAVAMDMRGHGASGTRGDIAYVGQLDDDLADLAAELRKTFASASFSLIGHSSGGGFALRIAAGPTGALFDRFVLLAPYLGYSAPTTRPVQDSNRWASPNIPRILAIQALDLAGVDWPQGLPTLAFAVAPPLQPILATHYSWRLMTNYTAPGDWKKALEQGRGRIAVLAGADDQLMDATAYKRELTPLGVTVRLIPGVDHIGLIYSPAALEALVGSL